MGVLGCFLRPVMSSGSRRKYVALRGYKRLRFMTAMSNRSRLTIILVLMMASLIFSRS